MLAAAVAVALAVWGPASCPTAYHVGDVPGPAVGLMRQTDGTCEVVIDRAWRWRWWELCAAVVHETGHAHGLPHSDDPSDVMFPVLWQRADACVGMRPAQYPPGAVIQF